MVDENSKIPEEMIPYVEFADNANERTPCVLVLDCSGSMRGEPIKQLNAGLKALENELKDDIDASSRVQLLIIKAFGKDEVETTSDWVDAMNFTAPVMEAGGLTPLGKAMELALQKIEEQKCLYDSCGITSKRPWIFLISDGEPTDYDWEIVAKKCRDAQNANLRSFSCGSPEVCPVCLRRLRMFPICLMIRAIGMTKNNPNKIKVVATSVCGPMHCYKKLPCQDCFKHKVGGKNFVAVVSDGAGSAQYGKIGANIVCNTMVDLLSNCDFKNIKTHIINAIEVARSKVMRHRFNKSKDKSGMIDFSATLVGAVYHQGKGIFFHIGDGAGIALNASQYGTNPYYIWNNIKEEARRSVINGKVDTDTDISKLLRSNFYIGTFDPRA